MHLNFRFDKIERDALTGIRRAAVFLGLGVNAADNKEHLEYRLSKDSRIELLPDVSTLVIEEWKSHFRSWIIGGAFRELVEHLCLFLDRIFYICTRIESSASKTTFKNYERAGLDKKLEYLAKEFGVRTQFNSALASLYPVRTCFVHRLGQVGKKDVEKGDLKLEWAAIRLFVQTPTGDVDLPLNPSDAHPLEFPQGGTVVAQPFAPRGRSFRLGDSINLNAHELTEILFFAQVCVRQLLISSIDYAKSKGVKFDGSETTPTTSSNS